MANHHFISYSSIDASDFALRLTDALVAGSPSITVWLDKRMLLPGEDWDGQIVEAIRTCESLLFVMTRDSVEDESVCKNEWVSALRYKKPIVPLKLHPDAELPFRLANRQYIDFTGAFEPALARLREHLQWLATPAGVLRTLEDRLADAQRDLRRPAPAQQARIQADIALLEQQIADQQLVVDNPQAAAQRVEQSIQRELALERQPERPNGGAARSKFINPPPGLAPSYFQDREIEQELIGTFLKDETQRLMLVVGRGGTGKTALVMRLLKALEQGQLPNDRGPLSVDGIVYLSSHGMRRANMPNLYADLCELLPDEIATRLDMLYKDPHASTEAKMQALLAEFPAGIVVLLLDGFEDLIDPVTLNIHDAELDEALAALMNAPQHGVKVIITSRVAPRTLTLVQPARQSRVDLDEGLSLTRGANVLREMDADGRVGLRDAPDTLLATAVERTRGYPRALEALFAILSADRDTSLEDILQNTSYFLPENVTAALVGEAFSRLDATSERVLQALAIYARPVTPSAVDYLLHPYMPGVNSAPVLGRLVGMQFARKEAGRYYLHPVDRAYAFDRVPVGMGADREVADSPPFTQFALLHRAAEYFRQARIPQSVHTIEDLAPQLTEFELRYAGEDYDTAGQIVVEIDKYLSTWSAHQLLIDLYERLQGRLSDPTLQQITLANLNRIRNLLKPSGFELVQTIGGHAGRITRLAWLPDGETLASASLDGSVRLWNTREGSLRAILRGHTKEVLAIAVTPDGRQLISASADATLKIWDLATETAIHTLRGHTSIVTGVAVLPDGRIISAAWDHTLKIWNPHTEAEEFTLNGHIDRINALALTPDGQYALSAAWDQTLRVWNLSTRQEVYTLAGRTGGDNDIAVLEGGKLAASATEDATIRLWDLSTGQQIRALEGPTAYVTGVSVSSDGRLLAAKSADGRVRLWRCDTWQQVAILSESSPANSAFAGLAFAPQAPILATLGEEDTIIRIWKLDLNILLQATAADEPIQYTTTKIALVGDSGVGKTGLGWRLAFGDFKAQSSTHGQFFWVVDRLRTIRSDRTECEVVLWDFAGQPDYRLVHALFLDDVDVGLLLFDPTERQDALKPVDYWLKHLLQREEQPPRAILVGARIDRGTPTLTPEELEAFCHHTGISGGYIGTSALTGDGVPELIARIKEQVNWNQKPPTISPKIFTMIKETVLRLRASNSDVAAKEQTIPLLLSPPDLSEQLLLLNPGATTKFRYEEMMTAVRHLAKHGYISILQRSSGEEVILLLPDLLNNLAASIVLEARRTNFGTIDENRLLRGEYSFPELVDLKPEDQKILLDAAAMLFLKHNLCFRKTIKNNTLLVFPSLINQKRPLTQAVETIDDVTYIVSGPVETVYPSLVVQLGNTNEFARTYTWQNYAQYEMGPDEVCGFRQIEIDEGEIELVLYYGARTPDYTRMIFQGYFEKFLTDHKVPWDKYPPVVCPNPECGKRQERSTIVNKIRDGMKFHFCGYCGTKIDLPKIGKDVALGALQQDKLNRDQVRARFRASFEATLVRLKRLAINRGEPTAIPQCSISYAWGVWEHERWVVQLATDLRNSGVDVVLDRWDNAEPSSSISRFISRISKCDFIIVVGTPEYRRKVENKDAATGYIAAAEFDVISNRLMGTELSKQSVTPLLLAGDVVTSLPELLHGRTYVDFREDNQYFPELLSIIIKMFRLPFDDPPIIDLLESMREETRKTGTLMGA